MGRNVFVGGNACKKIYVGTQEVKKVFVGTNQVYPSVKDNELGYWNDTCTRADFGGGHYYIAVWTTVLEKDYNNNRVRMKYEVGLGASGNWSISASTNRNGSGSIDGKTHSWTGNATVPSGGYKILYKNENVWIDNASGKSIDVRASHPLEVNISGVRQIGTVSVSGSVKLPTL